VSTRSSRQATPCTLVVSEPTGPSSTGGETITKEFLMRSVGTATRICHLLMRRDQRKHGGVAFNCAE
jgi:hypothetical protein